MEQRASGGLKSGLALTYSAGLAHTGFVVSPWRSQAAAGLQHPHALGSDDDEGLKPRGPGYTPRAAILALRASRVPDYFLPPLAYLCAPEYVIPIGRPLLGEPIRGGGALWREVKYRGS